MKKKLKKHITFRGLNRLYLILTILLFSFSILDGTANGYIIPMIESQFDTATFGATNPKGICYNSSTGEYVIVDASADVAYIVDSLGNLQSTFNTAIFGAASPTCYVSI
jgi:hypothetical protein